MGRKNIFSNFGDFNPLQVKMKQNISTMQKCSNGKDIETRKKPKRKEK